MKKLDPRSVLIGFLVAVIGFMSIGATNTTFESITVGEIILKNDALIFRGDTRQEPVLLLSAEKKFHGLFFINARGIITTKISEDDDGDGLIEVLNNKGQKIIKLKESRRGNGAIEVYNNKGQKIINITHSQASNGLINVYNRHQKSVVDLGTTGDDEGQIVLSDRYGEGQWGMTGEKK